MTLQEFFDLLRLHPTYIWSFFAFLPLTALLAGLIGKGEGHLSPWKYLYSALIYLACVPGIFAITLNVYLFLFERRSIMETELYTQVLPIVSMLLVVFLVKRNVSLKQVPGFDRLSGLMIAIAAAMMFLWIMEKTRIIIFSFLRIEYALVFFLILLLAGMFGMRRFFGSNKSVPVRK